MNMPAMQESHIDPQVAEDTPGHDLALNHSLAVLMQEYRPTMDLEAIHSWSHDLLGAIIVERARTQLRHHFPNASAKRLAEIEDEDHDAWKTCLKEAADALPLNTFAEETLPAPLPEIYEIVHQQHVNELTEETGEKVVVAVND